MGAAVVPNIDGCAGWAPKACVPPNADVAGLPKADWPKGVAAAVLLKLPKPVVPAPAPNVGLAPPNMSIVIVSSS